MVAVTAAETLLLNTEPQETNLYLSIYEPEMVGIFLISGSSYNQANQTINYYSSVSGSYTNIIGYNWEVALVGTSANDDSLGRTWVRTANSSILRFVESDHIDWASATYITILKYTEIIPIYPRIIQNPSDDEDVIFYKMWDISYTNQNSLLGTLITMGSNFAGFLDGGTGTCYWSASGTVNLIGDELTYSWIFEGATITGSTAHTPGYVAYNQPGHHRAILTVTSASGKVDRSTRYVSFYNRPGQGNNTPILNWELIDLDGHRDNIGYTCSIRVRESLSRIRLRNGMLIVIFGEDWYGSTKQSVSNNQKGRENIKFVGYIVGDTIQYNYTDGWVEFECASPTNFMELCECFSCSVESKTSPATWFELLNMDIRRATHHYLKWQSTVPSCCDIEFKNFTDRNIQYFDADRTSLYDAVNTLVDNARVGKLVSDSLGKLWFEQEVSVINNASSTLTTALSITKKDWIGEPIIDERQHQEVSYLESGGIYYSPASNESAAFLSGAPGISPAYRGKAEGRQGLALLNQSELNTINGNLFAYMNSKYPNIELFMRANLNNIDIAPQEKVLLTIASGDTPRNITFSDKAFAVRGKRISWDARTKRYLVTLSLAEITQGFVGDTIIIPIEPPDPDNPPGRPPRPPRPPEPPIEPPPPEESSGTDAIVTTSTDVRITSNLDDVSPTWTSIISSGTVPVDSDLSEINNDIFFVIESDSVWKCTNVTSSPTWTEVWTSDDLGTGGAGVAIEFGALVRVRIAPGTDNIIYVLGHGQVDGTSRPFVLKSSNGGATWTESWIDDELAAGSFTVLSSVDDGGGNGTAVYAGGGGTMLATLLFPDIGFPQVCYYAVVQFDPPIPDVNPVTIEFDATGDLPSENYDTDADLWPYINYEAFDPWVNLMANQIEQGYHIFGTLNGTQVDDINGDQSILHVGYFSTREARWENDTEATRNAIYSNFVINGVAYGTGNHLCIDVERSNSNNVYVGTPNSIWKSIDGAITWSQSISDHGSNDICADPGASGAYYHWSEDGSLELVVNDAVVPPDLDVETPLSVSLRLARDAGSGRLWKLDTGVELAMRDSGSWIVQDTGLSGARGLHSYMGGILFYLDSSDIYYSVDYGTTQSLKKGSWAEYGSPINAHLMRQI